MHVPTPSLFCCCCCCCSSSSSSSSSSSTAQLVIISPSRSITSDLDGACCSPLCSSRRKDQSKHGVGPTTIHVSAKQNPKGAYASGALGHRVDAETRLGPPAPCVTIPNTAASLSHAAKNALPACPPACPPACLPAVLRSCRVWAACERESGAQHKQAPEKVPVCCQCR